MKTRRDWLVLVALVALVLCGGFLRVRWLAHESAWYDEIVTLQALDAPSLVQFVKDERASDPPMTPVYFVLAYAWSRMISPSDLSMRWLSVLLGLSGIPLIYMLARLFYNRAASLIAGAALAFSLIHIYHSQEVRVYSLVLLLSMISTYSFVKILNNIGSRPACVRWAIVYACCNALLAFTQFMTLLLVASHFAYLLLTFRHKRLMLFWIVLHIAIVASLLLWLLPNLEKSASLGPWMPTVSWQQIGIFLRVFAGVSLSAWGADTHLEWVAVACMWLVILGHLISLYGGAKTATSDGERPRAALLMLCFLLPPTLLGMVSAFLKPMFVFRYCLFCIVPMYILLGGAICTPFKARWLTMLRWATLLLLVPTWGWLIQSVHAPLRADFIKAGRYLKEEVQQDETVLLPPTFKIALGYHFPELKDRLVGPLRPQEIMARVKDLQAAGKGAWTVLDIKQDLAAFNEQCRQQNVDHTRTFFYGTAPLWVYYFPPKLPVAQQNAANQQ